MNEPDSNGRVEVDERAGEAWTNLLEAVAAYFDCDAEGILGLVLAVERNDPEQGVTLSSIWSSTTPPWRLKSFARELLRQLEAGT